MLSSSMTRIPGRWQKYAPGVAVGVGLLMALAAAACFSGDPSASLGAEDTKKVKLRGCKVEGGSPPPTAPGGYYTNGTTVCSAADGTAHLFHGVDRPSMEWEPTGQEISLADFQAMVGWRANVVRIALNQDFWLSKAALHSPLYEATVVQAVQWAEEAGLDVILDLHWSDQGNLNVTEVGGQTPQDTPGGSAQQQMADVNSITFWSEVAAKFKGDGRVLFELYNEPNNISWDLWLNGGAGPGYQVAGMQQLYDAVRKAGAHNVVIAGGLQWAFDLSGVGTTPVQGYNIMYATHPYESNDSPGQWPVSFGYLAAGDIAPVIATEFGGSDCTGSWDSQLIEFANQYNVSWTAWAWYPGGCSFPSLIADWAYTPTEAGVAVQTALLAYPEPTPDAGAPDATRDGAADAKRDGHKEDAAPDEASLDEAGDALPADDAIDAATDGAVKTD
jgi:endoglucanase